VRGSILVLGLGNPLRGDDGVGPRIVAELERRDLPEGVTTMDVGTAGLDLLHLLEGWDRAIVVDAADVGLKPGQFARFTPDEARLAQNSDGLSFHQVGLSGVLSLANALGHPLPEIVIFGVQPAEIDWKEGLSPAVEAIIPKLIEMLIKEIESQL
jgi:hydrogenase maturation protease